MQAANTDFSEEIYSAPMPHLEVALAYQDLHTGLRARQFLYHILEECQMQVEFNLTLWNLALFHLPEIREQAVSNTCNANLVLVSVRGDAALEADTESWLNQWIARRGDEECALAVLIGSDMQRIDSIGNTLLWLQHITRPTQIRLFIGFTPPAAIEAPSPPQPPHAAQALPFAAREFSSRLDVHSEGGLNE